MARHVRPLFPALFLLALAALPALVPAQMRMFTKTAKDYISIRKITPRTGADLVTPSQLPYFIEARYKLTSLPKAEVQLRIVKWMKNRPMRALMTPTTTAAKKGEGTLLLKSPYLNLARSARGEQVLVIVSLKKPGGRELAYSQSFNYLRGSMKARVSSLAPSSDSMEVLNYKPRETAKIYAGQNQEFSFKLSYSLKSRKIGFVNIEFGDDDKAGSGTCWNAIVVPLHQGTGIVDIDTEPLFFPAALDGKTMGIGLLYRLDPLGGTHMIRYIKTFKFSAPVAP